MYRPTFCTTLPRACQGIAASKCPLVIQGLAPPVLAESSAGDLPTRQPQRPGSLAASAALLPHSALRIGKALLWQPILVGKQFRYLPGAVADEPSVAQHRALLPMADPAERAELADDDDNLHLGVGTGYRVPALLQLAQVEARVGNALATLCSLARELLQRYD